MTTTKNKINWNELAKKGEFENQLKEELSLFRSKIIENISNYKESPFSPNSNRFTSNFLKDLNEKLVKIFSKYTILSEKERKGKKERFISDINNDLNLVINKKALCSIEFDAYMFYLFIKALSSILDEIEIEIHPDKIHILTMDPLRIVIFDLNIRNNSYRFFQEGNIGVNLEDLQKVLKCKSSDLSQTTLTFGIEKIFILINSDKFHSKIESSLNCIDFHHEGDLKIVQLQKINYPCQFELSKEKLNYLIDNLGTYSEIIKIQCSSNKISFIEEGNQGKSEISWKKNHIKNIYVDFSLIKDELSNYLQNMGETTQEIQQNKVDGLKKESKKTFNHNYCEGSYSLEFFKANNKMATILDNLDVINFSLRDNYPLKSEIKFRKLGDMTLTFYISPRSPKEIED